MILLGVGQQNQALQPSAAMAIYFRHMQASLQRLKTKKPWH